MTEQQENNTTTNPDDTIIPPVSTTEYVDETTTDIPEPIPPDSKTENVNKEPIQVIVNIPKEENKSAITANRIAIIGTFINLALAGMTYLLFQKTIEANKTSQSALTEAQNAVQESRRANDIAEANFKLAQNSSAYSDSINNINLELSKKSVVTQINSVTESQRQFEKLNMPYLQCDEFSFINMEQDVQPKLSYKTTNLGNYPAKILDRKLGYFFAQNVPENPNKKIDFSKNSFDVYINKENPKTEIFTAGTLLPKDYYEAFKDSKIYFFFFGDITYQNEINGKKRVCSFYVKIFAPPSKEYKVIYNKNIDIN